VSALIAAVCAVNPNREQPEPAVGERGPNARARWRPGPVGGRGGRRPAYERGVDRHRARLHGGQDEQGVAPAVRVDEPARQGQEDGAGEAGDHGECQQVGRAVGGSGRGDDDGERRLVEAGRRRRADADLHHVQLPRVLHVGQRDQEQGAGQ
jgi:hypothetical protein